MRSKSAAGAGKQKSEAGANKQKKMGANGSKAQPRQAKQEAQQDSEYEVDKIVDWDGQKYRVRWLGYSSSHDTWEPIGNLENAAVAIHKYWSSMGKPAAAVPATARNNSTSRSQGSKKPAAAAAAGTPKVASGGIKKKKKAPTPKAATPKRA